MNRTAFLLHTRQAVRVILFSALGMGTVAGAGFAGTHLYLESIEPTPSTWPRKLRFAYRAAIFNSEYLGQPEAAKTGLLECLDSLKEEPDSAEKQNYAKALVLLGQIERRQGFLDAAAEYLTDALANDRDEGMTAIIKSSASRQLGEIQERTGDIRAAQKSYDLAISSLLSSHEPGTIPRLDGSVKYSAELVDGVKALALSRARQGHLKESLAALLSVLRYQQQHPGITSASCATAATMSHVAELVWALGDPAECRRWNQEALTICESAGNASDSYCLECAGISHNMLGLLSRRQGDEQEARIRFTKALACAERADDENGVLEYASNLEQAR